MIAYTMHLLRATSAQHVRVHPDGEHGKQFDFGGRRPTMPKPARIGLLVRLVDPLDDKNIEGLTPG